MTSIYNNKLQRAAAIAAGAFGASLVAIYHALNPAANDYQSQVDLQFHPVAVVVGALIPAIIFVPLAYWINGEDVTSASA